MNLINATYIATRPDRDPEALAENIAREQSLELLRELIPEAIAERLLGRVLGVERVDDDRWQLDVGYPAELASGQIGQLLHLLYGNVSFYPRIRLVSIELPEPLLSEFAGPRSGIAGIRARTGVPDRSLLMTALKPRGSAPEHLAELALRFARGGGDLIKDDQNLVERELQTFMHRITLCAQSIETASEITGRRCLYLPHVAGGGDFLRRQLEAVAELGLSGVVMCPWVMGLESAACAAREFDLMWLAHPAVAGSFTEPDDRGITMDVLLGTLVRLAGADISIFPGSGGRILSHHADDESATRRALTRPMAGIEPALPCTGGGQTLDSVPEAARRYGPNCAVLVAGDLLARGEDMEAAVRETVDSIVPVPGG